MKRHWPETIRWTWCLAATAIFMLGGCGLWQSKTPEVAGKAWLNNAKPAGGFYLASDGAVLPINYPEPNGQWTMKKDTLTISDANGQARDYQLASPADKLELTGNGQIYRETPVSGAILDIEWEPVYLDGQHDIVKPAMPEVTLIFNSATGRFSGCGGVNRLFGDFTLTAPDRIRIERINSTRMAGPGARYEGLFLSRLIHAERYLVVDGNLQLYNDANQLLISFQPNVN